VAGGCRKEITCKGSKFLELNTTECHCKTPEEKDCQICRFTGGLETPTKVCTSCKRSTYFRSTDARCVSAADCPEDTIPTGIYLKLFPPPSREAHSADCRKGLPNSLAHCRWAAAMSIPAAASPPQFRSNRVVAANAHAIITLIHVCYRGC